MYVSLLKNEYPLSSKGQFSFENKWLNFQWKPVHFFGPPEDCLTMFVIKVCQKEIFANSRWRLLQTLNTICNAMTGKAVYIYYVSVWISGRESGREKDILKSHAAYFLLILYYWEVLWLRFLVTVPPTPTPLSPFFLLPLLHGKGIENYKDRACKQRETIPSLSQHLVALETSREWELNLWNLLIICVRVCVSVCVCVWGGCPCGCTEKLLGFWHTAEEESLITVHNLSPCPLCPAFSLTNCYINEPIITN